MSDDYVQICYNLKDKEGNHYGFDYAIVSCPKCQSENTQEVDSKPYGEPWEDIEELQCVCLSCREKFTVLCGTTIVS